MGPLLPEARGRTSGLADRLIQGAGSLGRAESRLAILEGDLLHWLSQNNRARNTGFRTLAIAGRELLGLAPRTVRDRLAFHRLIAEHPEVGAVLEEGELSICQVLALAPSLRDCGRRADNDPAAGAGDSGEAHGSASDGPSDGAGSAGGSERDGVGGAVREILREAKGMSVREIREWVRGAVPAGASDGDGEEEVEGRTIRVDGPPIFHVVFEEMIELSRMVLGRDAPRYECVEAILSESGMGLPGAEDVGAGADCAGKAAADGSAVATEATAGRSGGHAAVPVGAEPRGTALAAGSGDVAAVAAPRLSERIAADRSAAWRTAPLSGTAGLVTMNDLLLAFDPWRMPPPPPPPPPPLPPAPIRPVHRATIERVERLLVEIEACCADLDDLLEAGGPKSPADAVLRLQQCRRLAAPVEALRCRALLELRRLRSVDRLGYRRIDDLAQECLGLSPRTARALSARAAAFERLPGLEEAFGSGRIGILKAMWIEKVATEATIEAFVARAQEVTLRYFGREVAFLELLRTVAPEIAQRFPGPLPAAGLEAALVQALGWTQAEERARFRKAKLGPPEGEASHDPAENPVVLHRLELLVKSLAMARAEAGAGLEDEKRQTSAACRGEETDPAVAKGDDRQTSAAFRPQPPPRMRPLRFWLPEPTAGDWRRALQAVREAHGRLTLPDWAAAVLLFAPVLREWTLQDPERIPTERVVLSRDRYRCQAPGCTQRSQLQRHHPHPRVHGGSDAAENGTALCNGCHNHMVHMGKLRVRGSAPHNLLWELKPGVAGYGRPPLFVFRGEKLVSSLFGIGLA